MGDGRGGAVLPGEAQRRGGEAWGGTRWSEHRGALGVSDGNFNGAQRVWSTRRRTRLSGGVLECWRSRTQAARAARGLWVLVDCGALALSSRTQRDWVRAWRVVQWLATLGAGQGVAVDGAACSRQGWHD